MRSTYLLAIILYLSNKTSAQNVGTSCVLSNGLIGVCASVENCLSAAALIKNRKRPEVCGFISIEPIVCCQRNSLLKTDPAQSTLNGLECAPLTTSSKIVEDLGAPPLGLRIKRARSTQNLREGSILDIHNIAGGIKAKEAEFPYMARLGIGANESTIEWYCGGSLISDKFILTAAHCIFSRFGAINWALLGDPESTFFIAPQRREQIISNIIHPNYNYSEHYNDIALSELKEAVAFGFNIRPACLYFEREIPTSRHMTITGWGSTEFGGEGTKDLLKADVSLFTYQECSKKYSSSIRKLPRGIEDDKQFCAGGRTEVKDTCQGDSGGPIQMKIRNTKFKHIYYIIGITSFGKICGHVNQPGVYVRLYPYLSWIESVVYNSTIIQ